MTIEDYEEVYALWMSIKGFGIRSIDDSKEGIERVFETKSDDKCSGRRRWAIVGAIFCGHDGRRGCFYHVCVDEDYRMTRHRKSNGSICDGALKKEEDQ